MPTVLLQAIRGLFRLWERNFQNTSREDLDERGTELESVLVWVIDRQVARALDGQPDATLPQSTMRSYSNRVTRLARTLAQHHAAMQHRHLDTNEAQTSAELTTLINDIDALVESLQCPDQVSHNESGGQTYSSP
ncbi:MAG: hypothetical protein J2P17_01015 [Mycobacterium sp.]|nr:hypothetical protein [Mycobacterium sp.]